MLILVLAALMGLQPASGGRACWQKPVQGQPMRDQQIATLIHVLADPQADTAHLEQTRRAIAELVKIGPPAVPQLVQVVVSGPRTAASYAALTLDEIGPPAVEAVRAAWAPLGEAGRWKLMRFRGKYDYAATLDFALASLKSRDDDVRSQAVRYLGQHKEERARDALLAKLNTEVPRLRWEVVDALTEMGNDSVVNAFIKLLAPDSWAAKGEGLLPPEGKAPPWWPDGRPRIITALRHLKAKSAAPAFLKLLQEKGPGKAYLGSFLIPALVEFGYRECIPELKKIVAANPRDLALALDTPAEIQTLAQDAIGHLGKRP
jgi:HEAT repeat protein